MALINCRECGNIVSDTAERCPHCGAPVRVEQAQGSGQQTTPPPSEGNDGKWIALGVAIGCIIGIIVFIVIIIAPRLMYGNNTKTADRTSSATAQQTQPEDEYEDYDEEEPSKPTSGYINGHEWVDLGLSVKWATCNVGASSPSEYGNYYAWGETKTKSLYDLNNCATFARNIGNIAGSSSYDAACANWGGTWRLPTASEIDELINKCQSTWTTMGGHTGYKLTGPSGKSIFLPAAGIRANTSIYYGGEYGNYWSATPYGSDTQQAYALYFDSGCFIRYWYRRDCGFSVRPVSD